MKNLTVLTVFLFFFIGFGQTSKLSPQHYKNKRKLFREHLPEKSVAVIFSAPIKNRANDVDYVYHQDPNFFYLTGWHQPHSVLSLIHI